VEIQVCNQLPTYADSVALPTFTRHTAVRHTSFDRYLLPAGPAAAGLLLGAQAGTDRQTDAGCLPGA